MLLEDVDFCIISPEGRNSFGLGRPSVNYSLTIDAAKHICMMSNSEQGLTIRKYFIEVEKRYRMQPTAESPEQLMSRALLMAQQTINNLKPMAALGEALVDSFILIEGNDIFVEQDSWEVAHMSPTF